MKVTKQETLYHKDHGATLKHKCGKMIETLPLLYFLSFFEWLLWPVFIIWLVWPLLILFPHMGQCSNNEDHHTFMYLQLKNYNLMIRKKYDSVLNASGGVPGCAMIQE